MDKVLIVGGDEGVFLKTQLVKFGYKKAKGFDDADIVWFTGGEDIEAKRYEQNPIAHSYNGWINPNRDEMEFRVAYEAINAGKLLFGVCRGLQLLNIVNGGSLYQDVDMHNSGHHYSIDIETGKKLLLNSVHHQACRPPSSAVVLCSTELSSFKLADNFSWYRETWEEFGDSEHSADIEALFFPETRCLGVQSHPEYSDRTDTTDYAFYLLDKYKKKN
jgi:gamma-glutamyl-gamma-aminobutyrate hydrolase PuuD